LDFETYLKQVLKVVNKTLDKVIFKKEGLGNSRRKEGGE